jgi:hypothetical protein
MVVIQRRKAGGREEGDRLGDSGSDWFEMV